MQGLVFTCSDLETCQVYKLTLLALLCTPNAAIPRPIHLLYTHISFLHVFSLCPTHLCMSFSPSPTFYSLWPHLCMSNSPDVAFTLILHASSPFCTPHPTSVRTTFYTLHPSVIPPSHAPTTLCTPCLLFTNVLYAPSIRMLRSPPMCCLPHPPFALPLHLLYSSLSSCVPHPPYIPHSPFACFIDLFHASSTFCKPNLLFPRPTHLLRAHPTFCTPPAPTFCTLLPPFASPTHFLHAHLP